MAFLYALPGAIAEGLIWGLMGIGVYISYKILDIADLTVDGADGTVAQALAAALAQLRIDLQMALAAVADGAVVVYHVVKVLVPEVLERALDRLAGALAQAAQGRMGDGVRQLLQKVQVLQRALVGDDPVQDLQHPLGALPAGNALAAAFVLGEVHEEPGHFHHTGLVVHDHKTAGANHGSHLLEGIEVQGQIQMLLGQAAAGGAADLHRFELGAIPHTAADVEDDLPQGGTHGHFDQAGVLDVARQGKSLGARAVFRADGAVPVRPTGNDMRHIGQRLHIVEHSGLVKQATLHGAGRLDPGHTPAALDGGGEGAAFAADKSTGAPADVDIKIKTASQNVFAQQPQLPGLAQ